MKRGSSKEEMAARSFDKWIRTLDRTLTWDARHHTHLFRRLAKLTSGDVVRLMISMPPRHGKSEAVTIRYTAWRIVRDPKLRVIVACYNQRLANRFSLRIRRMLTGRVAMAADKRAVDEWETTDGGGVKAVGVGAGVTGFGAGLIVIDDPVKGRAEAESMVRRNHLWEWYTDDLYTRLEPNGQIILIQTRWHEDDLAGRLRREAEDGGDQWDELTLPALAGENDPAERQPGEALWPERFDVEKLEAARRRQGSYSFAALYQQRPTPRSGGIFSREWFGRVIKRPPPRLRWARGYDLAVSTRTTADYTASFRCAFDVNGTLYIADGFRSRIEYPEQRRFVLGRITAERNTIHGIESALHGKALVQDLRQERGLQGRQLRAVNADKDKVTRALAWAPLAEERRVVLIDGPWVREFIDEAAAFPHGEHDDQIDAVSLAVQMLRRRPNRGYSFD